MSIMNPLVSVVITTKNEEKNIENCLQSIKDQSYSNIEIIVVDNFSTDKTREISLKYTDKVYDKGPERSAQRNYGIKRSSGEWFIILDADMTLSRNVVKECIEKIKQDIFPVALYIPEIVKGDNFFSKVRRFERKFYDGTVIDGVRFIKKDVFLEVGGFDERMYACEDWDLTKKIKEKGRVSLIKSILYHNEAEFSLREYLEKKGYYLKNINVYIEKWGRNDPDIKKQFSLYYRYFGVFLENGKWKKLLSHPILIFGMYFLRGLVGAVYLIDKR